MNRIDLYSSLLPTKEQAQAQFWGLDQDYWKQIIDGKYHHLGKLVFDEALHKGAREPGFLHSLILGCNFAAKHMGECPSVEFYKKLHKKLCGHFKGKENDTMITADQVGQFRTRETSSQLRDINDEYPEFKEHKSLCQGIMYDVKWYNFEYRAKNQEEYNNLCSRSENSIIELKKLSMQWESKGKIISKNIEEMCKKFSIANIVNFMVIENTYCILYNFTPSLDDDINNFFSLYNKRIDYINEKYQGKPDKIEKAINKKIQAIANLFQMLEWFHPFPDGQGRTDLVLLSKLLCDQGANPAILHDPYISSYSTPAEWETDLKKGMENWRETARAGNLLFS